MTKKKNLLLLATFIVIFYIFIIQPNGNKKRIIDQERKFQIQLSHESSLAYGEYAYFYATAGEDDKFRWEFSGTNSYVGIKGYAMTDTEFSKFQSLQTFYSYLLSNGSYYRDSGIFYPPSYDTWYIVFLNIDSSMQTTYLTYDVDLERGNIGGDNYLFESIFYPILAAIIIGGIIIAAAEYSNKQKKKREAEIVSKIETRLKSTEPQPSQMDYGLKYCSQCGTPQKMDAIYCVKCGNKID